MTHGSDFMFEDISKVLLITDMDGTFLTASKIPTPKTLAAVKRIEEAEQRKVRQQGSGKCHRHGTQKAG